MADTLPPLTLNWSGWTRQDLDFTFLLVHDASRACLYFRRGAMGQWQVSYKLSERPSHPITAVERPAARDLASAEIDALHALNNAIQLEHHRVAAMLTDLDRLDAGLPRRSEVSGG